MTPPPPAQERGLGDKIRVAAAEAEAAVEAAEAAAAGAAVGNVRAHILLVGQHIVCDVEEEHRRVDGAQFLDFRVRVGIALITRARLHETFGRGPFFAALAGLSTCLNSAAWAAGHELQ